MSPLVCAVMLTRGRRAMALRAIEAFRAQTREDKRMLIFDSTPFPGREALFGIGDVDVHGAELLQGLTIGTLRNRANAATKCDIICHWDDDDWSHPKRIAEQSEFLESSGGDAVGRKTWERKPFPNLPLRPMGTGEDYEWSKGLRVAVAPSIIDGEPRMIARIHPGNTSQAYDLEALVKLGTTTWKRVPEWDDYCRERMAL